MTERPLFQIPGDLPKVADQVTALLIAADLQIYQRKGRLARRIIDDDGGAAWLPMQIIHMRLQLSEVARFEKYDGRSESYVSVDPPAKIASIILKEYQGAFPEYREDQS
jgi:hypothetical protein